MAAADLQSKDGRDMLDVVDNLRSQGVSRYIDLPEIIVCGDQSAGKSSVLEAISGLSFPSKENLCTRFATELVLRRDAHVKCTVTITPGPDRTAAEVAKLDNYRPSINPSKPDLGPVIEGAKESMGINNNRAFSSDTLRIELCGPSQPHLTMVDLPGLFRAGNTEQSIQGASTVRNMVNHYMKRERCIILAVVSAGTQFAVQEVTELARAADPMGLRTMGLITKPDKLDIGSDMEKAYFDLAQNKDVKFRLGWHVLKNRDYNMRDASLAERDAAEEAFFSTGLWKALGSRITGVKSLKPRLSDILKNQIILQLPNLLKDVEVGIADCQHKLDQLGSPRATTYEQRRYLVKISSEFQSLMNTSVNGVYQPAFFGVNPSAEESEKRIRAKIQDTLENFSHTMESSGEKKVIVDVESSRNLKPREVQRSVYLDHVKTCIQTNRGRELIGTFNPLIIGELFREQAEPWADLTNALRMHIIDICKDAIMHVIDYSAAEDSVEGLRDIVFEGLQHLEFDLEVKMDELLHQALHGHAITYNEALVEIAQRAQAGRMKANMEKKLNSSWNNNNLSKSTVLLWMTEAVESNTREYAASFATDYMQAYYKVALKRFIDDLSVIAVEGCMLEKLADLLTPDIVCELSDEEVASIASEGEASSLERKNYTDKLAALEEGFRGLSRLSKHGVGVASKRSRESQERAASFKRGRRY